MPFSISGWCVVLAFSAISVLSVMACSRRGVDAKRWRRSKSIDLWRRSGAYVYRLAHWPRGRSGVSVPREPPAASLHSGEVSIAWLPSGRACRQCHELASAGIIFRAALPAENVASPKHRVAADSLETRGQWMNLGRAVTWGVYGVGSVRQAIRKSGGDRILSPVDGREGGVVHALTTTRGEVKLLFRATRQHVLH